MIRTPIKYVKDLEEVNLIPDSEALQVRVQVGGQTKAFQLVPVSYYENTVRPKLPEYVQGLNANENSDYVERHLSVLDQPKIARLGLDLSGALIMHIGNTDYVAARGCVRRRFDSLAHLVSTLESNWPAGWSVTTANKSDVVLKLREVFKATLGDSEVSPLFTSEVAMTAVSGLGQAYGIDAGWSRVVSSTLWPGHFYFVRLSLPGAKHTLTIADGGGLGYAAYPLTFMFDGAVGPTLGPSPRGMFAYTYTNSGTALTLAQQRTRYMTVCPRLNLSTSVNLVGYVAQEFYDLPMTEFYAIGLPEQAASIAAKIDVISEHVVKVIDDTMMLNFDNGFFEEIFNMLIEQGKASQQDKDDAMEKISQKDMTANVTVCSNMITFPYNFASLLTLYNEYESARIQCGEGTPFLDLDIATGVTWRTAINRVKSLKLAMLVMFEYELVVPSLDSIVLPEETERDVLGIELSIDEGSLVFRVNGAISNLAEWREVEYTGEAVWDRTSLTDPMKALWPATFGHTYANHDLTKTDGSARMTKEQMIASFRGTLSQLVPTHFLHPSGGQKYLQALCCTYGLTASRTKLAELYASQLGVMGGSWIV